MIGCLLWEIQTWNSDQDEGMPLHDGGKTWVEEEIDMTESGDSIHYASNWYPITVTGYLMISNYISMEVWILSSTMYPM